MTNTKPEASALTKSLRRRIQLLHLDGLAPDDIAAQLACPEAMVEKYLRGLVLYGKQKETQCTKALRMRIQRLHLEGLDPDEIATQIACPEALIWKDLRGLYKERNNLSDDYRQMRVARIYTLKQQGLELLDIAELMGFNIVLLNKDMREMPQDQARASNTRFDNNSTGGGLQPSIVSATFYCTDWFLDGVGEQCSLRLNVLDTKLRCVGLDLSQLIETLWVENLLLKKTGQGFEDFFTDTAKLHWGEDFEPWKPQGSLGDFKCDGYRVSEKRVFQCYAPEHAQPSRTATKILTDFDGAKSHFGSRMESWVFVYNQSEMPAACGKLLGDLREANQSIRINVWHRIDLLQFALALSPEGLALLLPNWQKDVGIGETLINAMSELVSANTVSNPPTADVAAGTNQVTLIQALDRLRRHSTISESQSFVPASV